jgi:hypothetical protein
LNVLLKDFRTGFIVRSIKEALAKDAVDIELQLAGFTLVEDFAKVTTIQEREKAGRIPYVS